VPSEGNDIIIGIGCWIAAGVIISGGVTIGNNVIIGANSFVNKNIPCNTFAAGNPARVIKKL
jgi:maltose O-acetyltransferase